MADSNVAVMRRACITKKKTQPCQFPNHPFRGLKYARFAVGLAGGHTAAETGGIKVCHNGIKAGNGLIGCQCVKYWIRKGKALLLVACVIYYVYYAYYVYYVYYI